MPRWLVDPAIVREVKMKDGTRYRPSAAGVVSVAARHEREMERSGSRRSYEEGEPLGPRIGAVEGGERPCPTCGRTNWPWQDRCGRCGELLDQG